MLFPSAAPATNLVLGACADRAATARQFEAYADLVAVGSRVVVTDTVVNRRPVWPSFGPGPFEAVKPVLTNPGGICVGCGGRRRGSAA